MLGFLGVHVALCLDIFGMRIVVLDAMSLVIEWTKASTTATGLRTFVLVSWFRRVLSEVNR